MIGRAGSALWEVGPADPSWMPNWWVSIAASVVICGPSAVRRWKGAAGRNAKPPPRAVNFNLVCIPTRFGAHPDEIAHHKRRTTGLPTHAAQITAPETLQPHVTGKGTGRVSFVCDSVRECDGPPFTHFRTPNCLYLARTTPVTADESPALRVQGSCTHRVKLHLLLCMPASPAINS